MNVTINRALIEQTSFDSATPTGTAIVVHQFEQVGEYNISVTRDDQVIDRLRLNVPGPRGPAESEAQTVQPPAEQAQPGSAVSVDLASIAATAEADRRLAVAPGGYVAFSAPPGAPPLSATVARADAESGDVEFDSRRLGPGDLFAVTLIRPGRYTASNTATGNSLEIQVMYPQVGTTPYRPPDPVNIECRADGFSAEQVSLGPAQGIIFHISTETRIQIELTEPDDGPSQEARPQAIWRRPQRSERDETTDQ
jgi:hypothetical protein